jgi:hypothetical protein
MPGWETVREGGLIWHGTNVRTFEDRSPGAQPGKTSTKPSPPAWFAGDPQFSAHVTAFMHPSQAAYMNAYEIRSDLRLLAFDDIADLNTYLGPPFAVDRENDAVTAGAVGLRAGAIDGYMLEQDAVLGVTEYILFAAGLAKLRRTDQLVFREDEVRGPNQRPGDEPSRRHTFYGQHMGTLTGIDYSAQ